MNEEILEQDLIQVEKVQDIQVNIPTENIEKDLQNVESSVNDLLNFFQNEKKEEQKEEQQLKEQEKKEQQEQLKLEEKEKQDNLILEKENKKIEEQEKKEQLEFYSNIETIAENTDSQISVELLSNVNTLMQVSILTNGILIGIVCIFLFSRVFKK